MQIRMLHSSILRRRRDAVAYAGLLVCTSRFPLSPKDWTTVLYLTLARPERLIGSAILRAIGLLFFSDPAIEQTEAERCRPICTLVVHKCSSLFEHDIPGCVLYLLFCTIVPESPAAKSLHLCVAEEPQTRVRSRQVTDRLV